MYNTLNIIDNLLEKASQLVVQNDRELYVPFLAAAEKYCIQNGGILGGRHGINVLLGREENHMMDIYIENVFNHSKGIADLMYSSALENNSIPIKTIYVDTRLKNKHYTIWVNGRPLVNCIGVDVYRGIKLIDLTDAVEVDSRYNKGEKVKCMGVKVQLIYIYRLLYQPYGAKDQESYTKLLELEDGLINSQNISGSNDIIEGGGAVIEIRDFVEIIIGVVREFISANSSNVIIGDYALGSEGLCGITPKFDSRKRFQMISAEDPENILNKTINIISRIMKKSTYSATMVDYDLKLVNDQHLRKYTFYITNGKDTQPLFDVFNSTTYEVVPFRIAKIGADKGYSTKGKIAGWFTLIRFQLIQLYNIKIIMLLGTSNEKYLSEMINHLNSCIKELRAVIYEKIITHPFEVFPTENFEGCFIEQNILFKKLIANEKQMFGRYYPHIKFTKNESESESESSSDSDSSSDSESSSSDQSNTQKHGGGKNIGFVPYFEDSE